MIFITQLIALFNNYRKEENEIMEFTVINHELSVGTIRIIGVSTSSLFLIGDSQVITLSSIFDTPPESLIIGPLVPLSPEQ